MTTTNDLTRLASALGWTNNFDDAMASARIIQTHTGERFDMSRPRDRRVCIEAAEATLTEGQRGAYVKELCKQLWPTYKGWYDRCDLDFDETYELLTAPAEVRLRALRAVCDRSPHTAGRGRWNQR